MNSGRYSVRSSGRNSGGEGYGTARPGGQDIEAGDVLLAVEDVSLAFGGVKAVSGVSFDFRKREIRAIIGPNGAGKSSMLNVINGVYQPQRGRITFKGRPRPHMRPYEAAPGGIARTFQNVALFKGMTALDNIIGAYADDAPWLALAAVAARAGVDGKRRHRHRVEEIIDFLRFRHIRKVQVGNCPMACRSGLSSVARLPWSPISCCSTNRWPE